MKNEEILKKLREAGTYVSGQELCEQYGVSRTAIWKAIRQLEKEGYVIEAQNNRGYRLVEKDGADLFSKIELESKLETAWVGRKLVFQKETGSTNIDAKELAENGEASGAVVVADMQTAGRGRRGRGWVSPAGKDIYMTIMLRPQCRPEKASVLTLVMALAVLEAVSELLSPAPPGRTAQQGRSDEESAAGHAGWRHYRRRCRNAVLARTAKRMGSEILRLSHLRHGDELHRVRH